MKSPFFARYARPILIAALILTPFVLLGAWRSVKSNANDVSQWLPTDYAETKVYRWYRDHFASETFVLVSWEGCTLDDPRLVQLAETLVPPPGAEKPLGKDGKPLPEYFARVRTGPQFLAELTRPPAGLDEESALARLEGLLIGADHQQTCLILDLSEFGQQQKQLRPSLDRILAATDAVGIPRADLKMGGPPVDNVAIDRAGERSMLRLASCAAVLGLAISWFCLRSIRLTILVFSAGTYAAFLSLAIHYYSGSAMNAILLTMPPLVYVATVSGAIHLANYYRDAIREGGLAGAPDRAVAHAFLPLSLAAGTTAVGLVSLATSDLTPIRMFGAYSAVGVLGSLGVLFLILPAAFEYFPFRDRLAAKRDPSDDTVHVDADGRLTREGRREIWRASRPWRLAGWTVIDRPWLAGGLAFAAMFAFGWGMTYIQTSVQLMRLFSADAPLRHDYAWLEEKLGPLVPMEVILKFDPRCELTFLERLELIEQVQLAVEDMPDVGNALSAVTFSPPLDTYGEPGTLRTKLPRDGFSRRLAKHRDEYIRGGYLAMDGDVELWRISARVAALRDIDYGTFIYDIKGRVSPVLEAAAQEGVAGLDVEYTGLVPLVYKAQRTLLDGLFYGLAFDVLLIVVAMCFLMRDWTAGLLLLIPSIAPVVVVFGMMGWMGVVVDIGTVMAPCVALGVSVDDIAHFLIWFREGVRRGLNQAQSVMLAYRGCAEAMYQSWGVIGLGLSVFALSEFVPTQRFGQMMISLLSVALVSNLILLPALLASPLGSIFYRNLARRRAAELAAEKAAGERRPAASATEPETPATDDSEAPAQEHAGAH